VLVRSGHFELGSKSRPESLVEILSSRMLSISYLPSQIFQVLWRIVSSSRGV
jgi:hypothetical protein